MLIAGYSRDLLGMEVSGLLPCSLDLLNVIRLLVRLRKDLGRLSEVAVAQRNPPSASL
ncbi:MAG: hypothetical protein QXR19_03920 [Candidatus Jordarchaeaceae archaeon]